MGTPTPPARRILYVENGIGYGGAIICLRHLVRNLDRSRYEPIVVTGRGGKPYDEISGEALWCHVRDRRIDIPALRTRFRSRSWLSRLSPARWAVEQILARLDDLLNFVPFFVGLLQVARRYRPALIHANNEPLCNRAALLVARLLSIPVVCHVRGEQQGGRLLRWLYGLPDHYIAVSNWISEGIGRMGVGPDKRTVIYDGIELRKLDVGADGRAFRVRFGIAEDAFAVGLVGLLIPWKGQKLFLEAARQLLPRIPKLHLLIVGGTPDECADYESDLRRIAGEPPFAGRVTFTGHVAEMAAAYNGLDVVLSASTSPEPLGTVVIESLALGRPLVAPDHGGALEMVEHDRTGLLFRANDPASLAAAIERLHAEPDLGRRIGALARALALETFAVETHAGRVQAIYESMLAPRGDVASAAADRPSQRVLP